MYVVGEVTIDDISGQRRMRFVSESLHLIDVLVLCCHWLCWSRFTHIGLQPPNCEWWAQEEISNQPGCSSNNHSKMLLGDYPSSVTSPT